MNYGFIIDNRKCIGCHACTVACKAEHDVPIGVNRTWVKYIEKGEYPNTRRLFSVMRCNHCSDAPCVEICPVEALHIRDDGIVDFDNRRCIGCKACTQACPYDALYIDPNTHTAAKCNYCAHRVDIGLEPACVNVCPEHAIISGDLDDPGSEILQLLFREQVTARKPEKGTLPKLFYIGGDEASLVPSKTDKSTDYMWNAQATGVGHYARYAEKLAAKAEPVSMVKQLSGNGNGQWVGAGNEDSERVMVPEGENQQKMLQKAMEVFKETARRVYDAPGKGVLWGWEVSAYVWTKAISAGSFLVIFPALAFGLAPVSESIQWLGLGLGLLFLGLTGGLLVKDLDKPARFTYVLLRPQWKSWLVRGGYSITFFGGFLTLWGVSKLLVWQALEPIALWGSAIFAIVTAVYTAFLFAQAKGRDFWQSPALLLHMLGHSVIAGAATLAIFAPLMGAEESWLSYLRMVFYVGIIFNLVIILAETITAHPTADAQKTVKMIVSGRFRAHFWFGTIIFGNIFPLLLIAFGGNSLLLLAGLVILAGIYITEHIWVRAPQLIPLS
jgi:Fe-S-cluster-containing dehydrogenase component/formate-dependent nitrite reductase membrane component NrfD